MYVADVASPVAVNALASAELLAVPLALLTLYQRGLTFFAILGIHRPFSPKVTRLNRTVSIPVDRRSAAINVPNRAR